MAKLSDYKPTDLSSITQELENQGVMPNTNVTDTGITSVLTGDLAPTADQLGGLEKYTLPQSLAIAGEAGLSGIKTNLLGTPKKLSTESQRLINTLQGYKRNPDQSLRFELQDVLDPELFGGSIIGKESYGSPTKEQIEKTWEQVGINPDDMIPGTYDPETGIPYQAGLGLKQAWDLYRAYKLAQKAKKYGPKVIDKGKQFLTKKKKTPTITTAKGPPSITQIKKHKAPGGGGYGPHTKTKPKPKYKPPQQTGGGGGVHRGMKTTSSRRHKAPGGSGYGPHKKADGGLINFYKYGGFLG